MLGAGQNTKLPTSVYELRGKHSPCPCALGLGWSSGRSGPGLPPASASAIVPAPTQIPTAASFLLGLPVSGLRHWNAPSSVQVWLDQPKAYHGSLMPSR